MQIQSVQVWWNAVMMSIRLITPFSVMPSVFSTVKRQQCNDPRETVRRGVMCDTASLRLMTWILIQEVRDWNRQSEDVFGCFFFFPTLSQHKTDPNCFYRMFSHRETSPGSQHAWPWNPVHSISVNMSDPCSCLQEVWEQQCPNKEVYCCNPFHPLCYTMDAEVEKPPPKLKVTKHNKQKTKQA